MRKNVDIDRLEYQLARARKKGINFYQRVTMVKSVNKSDAVYYLNLLKKAPE